MQVQPLNHMQKRTKIPLSGLMYGADNRQVPKEFQIIVSKRGIDKERYGSVSFKLKRFQDKGGRTFKHWVTLYDSLDDDLFEGTEGVDDEFDFPRIYVEYTVVSGQYTSIANKIDDFTSDANKVRDKQEQRKNDRRSKASRRTGT